MRGTAAIVGVGHGGMGEAPGRSHFDIIADATHAALADAGLKLSDVDGVFSATMINSMPAVSVTEYLGLRPKVTEGTNTGGSSFLAHLQWAALALDAGLCEVALITYGSNQKTGAGKFVSTSEVVPFEAPYKPRYPVSAYALAAARHMYEFGTTREQLAEVAVAARTWANLNPEAYATGPLTIDDVLNSRMLSSPLTVRDCCLVTDGAGAIIMVKADRAKDFPKAPVYVLGVAAENWHRWVSSMPDLTVSAASRSGPRAMEMAGVTHADIDLTMLYDAFTITPVMFLEDLGFCPKGEGGRFVADGKLRHGGGFPLNTNGGGLSCVHPGMYGLFLLIEAVRQLRGECGARQLDNPQIALCHGNGGHWSSQVTAILGTGATL
ncbi:thiolase [Oleomonas cavernae]|uniref:Thiolase n=2 Tax=Oleomonas cavernae TaxID=2320859 RepID=A0A418WIY3_9PROT|nr:thiolase [Oleomonas cavernae]